MARCVGCHGGEIQKGGLRLDLKAAAMLGADSGPVIAAGKSAESELFRRITAADPKRAMPPGSRLPAREIELLRGWIDGGAAWPDEPESGVRRSAHWSFQPIRRAVVPRVREQGRVRNPVDAFILATLERRGIRPSPEADRTTLIRRVSLDLTGLPPTPEEVEAFVGDRQPGAYERLVDRLLASPRYGERWARWWLDAARYADSNGYTIDSARQIWMYRDWVINALNRDLPFDQFTIQQIAGDLLVKRGELGAVAGTDGGRDQTTLVSKGLVTASLTPEQRDALIATGYHRNTLFNEEGGTDPEQFRVEAVADRVSTTGTVFLGLTVGCAQCHTHKFDPITQREYYQLFALFNDADEPQLPVAPPERIREQEGVREQLAAARQSLESHDRGQPERQAEWERRIAAGEPSGAGIAAAIREIVQVPAGRRTVMQAEILSAEFRRRDPERVRLAAAVTDLEKRERELEKSIPSTLVILARPAPRESFVHVRGDFLRKGARVLPGVPAALPPLGAGGTRPPDRLDFARWLVSPENPLTARVTVNRVWQAVFGTGIVETENDFGRQGARPSHPELLDWLAGGFAGRWALGVRRWEGSAVQGSDVLLAGSGPSPSGRTAAPPNTDPNAQRPTPNAAPWSLKALLRLIVTSSAYRQSSGWRPELKAVDPANRLLARQSRLRLEAEGIRDAALAASGLLSAKVGGPSVFPPQPGGLELFTQNKKDWKASEGEDRYRRGLYTFHWRSSPYPLFAALDAPNGNTACTRRGRSNTPVAALMLANDASLFELAQGLAARVLRDVSGSDADRLRCAFRRCLGRQPTARESGRLLSYLEAQRRSFAAAPMEATAVAPAGGAAGAGTAEGAAWTAVARVLMNLDEFITRE
jgi:hypothetical protein